MLRTRHTSLSLLGMTVLIVGLLTACGGEEATYAVKSSATASANGNAIATPRTVQQTSPPSAGGASAASPATGGGGAPSADDGSSYGGTKFATEQVAQKVTVSVDAAGQFKWGKTEYAATAGDVTFVVKNPSATDHEFAVDGNGINYTSPTLKAGTTGRYTIKGLKAGEYRIVCKVAGHEQLGMVAKLVVK